MIYPRSNRLFHGILYVYIKFLLKKHFQAINFNEVTADPNKSVLLIANHFSAWDGLVLYWAVHRSLNKKFFIMLLEETAKKEPMLKYGGAFSINKRSKDMVQSLDYAAQLLADPASLVVIFPQGKLFSNFIGEVKFEKGVLKIMEKAQGKYQLVYAATFIENFKYKKPTAHIYLSTPTNCTFTTIGVLTESYQQHYHAARLQQIKIEQ